MVRWCCDRHGHVSGRTAPTRDQIQEWYDHDDGDVPDGTEQVDAVLDREVKCYISKEPPRESEREPHRA